MPRWQKLHWRMIRVARKPQNENSSRSAALLVPAKALARGERTLRGREGKQHSFFGRISLACG